MDHQLLSEVFRAAREYHAALARYAATLRQRADIESATQAGVGTSLRYRVALDKLAANSDDETLALVAGARRRARIRRLLPSTSPRHNIVKRPHKAYRLSSAAGRIP